LRSAITGPLPVYEGKINGLKTIKFNNLALFLINSGEMLNHLIRLENFVLSVLDFESYIPYVWETLGASGLTYFLLSPFNKILFSSLAYER